MLNTAVNTQSLNINVITKAHHIHCYKLCTDSKFNTFMSIYDFESLKHNHLENYKRLYKDESDITNALYTLLSNNEERRQFCSDEMLLHYVNLYIAYSGAIYDYINHYVGVSLDIYIALTSTNDRVSHYVYAEERECSDAE